MKVTTRSRYGLRAMIYLAGQDRPSPAQAVARHEGISKKYLDAILKQLREAGLLRSVRGPGGGYRLSRRPEDIAVAEVVHVLEDSLAVVSCVKASSACSKVEACPAHQVWKKVSETVEKTLAGITLADLIHWRPGGPLSLS